MVDFDSLLVGESFEWDGETFVKMSANMARSSNGQWIASARFSDPFAQTEMVKPV